MELCSIIVVTTLSPSRNSVSSEYMTALTASVDVLVPGRERLVQCHQFPRRLGARRVVRHDPAQRGKREMLADGADVKRLGSGDFPPLIALEPPVG